MNSPNIEFEKSQLPSNCHFVLGIDEVGRGPWAGPVTIGAFVLDINIFDKHPALLKIKDSKLLSEKNREDLYQYFLDNNFLFKTFSSTAQEIDELGIQTCINQNIDSAVNHFSSQVDFILIDGNMKLKLSRDYKSIVSGDKQCFSIAAASICAKVERDREMAIFHQEYPVYGFNSHKGYGTAAHIKAIHDNGICRIHRRSYKPLRDYL